jgi:hypothetical protein
MAEMRAAEEKRLNEAGWVDQKKGIVRLPIETAKQLTVQRLGAAAAVPAVQQAAPQAAPQASGETGVRP